MKFQVKFYDVIDHNKCPSSKKSAEKCILRKSFFHHSEPNYRLRKSLGCGRSLTSFSAPGDWAWALVPGLQLICNLCNNEPLVTPRQGIFTGTQQTFPTTDHYCGGNFNSCALYIYCTCSAAGCWSNSLFWKTFSSI